MKRKIVVLFLMAAVMLLILNAVNAETFGVKKKKPKPHEYGNVVINNYSSRANIPPAVFNHWLHRAKYTCRLCHIDIGFAMAAGKTDITCSDNDNGMYCGACHDGKDAFGKTEILPGGKEKKNCELCHSYGKTVKFKADFYKFKEKLPVERFGNSIDWMKAEDKHLLTLTDYLPGISIEKDKIKNPKEMQLSSSETGMPDILFSHEKHSVWNGCEVCHPEIFGIRYGVTVYNMQEIFDGKYCGVCHGKVAFPNFDCQRCHTKIVY